MYGPSSIYSPVYARWGSGAAAFAMRPGYFP
jgi:hypothetical protein